MIINDRYFSYKNPYYRERERGKIKRKKKTKK
jgi:hypothetical protein